jgi:hypothetical protein
VRKILFTILGLLAALLVTPTAPADAVSCVHHSDEAWDNHTTGSDEGQNSYRWGLIITWDHCVTSSGYYDDKDTLKVYGKQTAGSPYCDALGDIGGYTKYLADVGAWGTFNPGEVEWACTSSTSWSYTWVFSPQPRAWNGAGDRCVAASWKMPRWGPYTDSSGNIPSVCY